MKNKVKKKKKKSKHKTNLNATDIFLNSSNVSPTRDEVISLTNDAFLFAKLLGVMYPPTVSSPAGPPISGGKPPLSPIRRITYLMIYTR